MSKKDNDLLDALRGAIVTESVLHAVVEGVDKEKALITCSVGGKLFKNVSLRSVVSDSMGVVFYPALRSVVFCSQLPHSNRLIVLAVSEIESFSIKVNNVELSGDADGLVLKNGGESLKSIMVDTFDALMAMTVTTGVGPSGTPINLADFQHLKTRLDNLLNK